MGLFSRPEPRPDWPHVVIVGGGFGGLLAARGLARAKVRVTLIDRRNHHLFQPLLYQVATGGLSPANIAAPLRALLAKQKNATVLMREVSGFDLDDREVHFSDDGADDGTADHDPLSYDFLVVATGAGQSYFGNDQWEEHAPGLKTLDDALHIRRDVLLAFEKAEQSDDAEEIEALTTFVVVGAGPTGVEMAGALAEVAHGTLRGEFRHLDTAQARVILVEGMERVLPPFSEEQSEHAGHDLEKLGVEVRTGTMVREIRQGELDLAPVDGADPREDDAGAKDGVETLRAGTIVWAAGVQASPLGEDLANQSDAGLERSGKVRVDPDCSLPGRPDVFVVGDLAHLEQDGEVLPGLAPVAMQQGRYVAERVRRLAEGGRPAKENFRYLDKGSMAVIGRRMAVADIRGLEFHGAFAWLLWLFVHLMYLAEFQNRVLVLIQWGWNYFTRNRSARLITGDPGSPRRPPDTEIARGSA